MGRVLVYQAHGGTLERLDVDANTLDEATLKTAHGIYTVLRLYPGRRVLRLDKHFQRMHRSAELLNTHYQIDDGWLRNAVRQAVINGEELGITIPRVRITVPFDAPDSALIALEPFTPPAPGVYENGVTVALAHVHRDLPRAKNSRFIEQRRQIEISQPQSSYEILLVGEHGELLEGTGSNFYAMLDGDLHTAEEGMLPGITRGVLLEAASGVVTINNTPVCLDDLPGLSEAMLSSSSRGVVPIVHIGDQVVGEGRPGPIYGMLHERYDALVERELEPL
jgi:branched-subunit amino acid aminotransferase/4-amino-4-deoxychorismate lyase